MKTIHRYEGLSPQLSDRGSDKVISFEDGEVTVELVMTRQVFNELTSFEQNIVAAFDNKVSLEKAKAELAREREQFRDELEKEFDLKIQEFIQKVTPESSPPPTETVQAEPATVERKGVKEIILDALRTGPATRQELNQFIYDAGWKSGVTTQLAELEESKKVVKSWNGVKGPGSVTTYRLPDWPIVEGPKIEAPVVETPPLKLSAAAESFKIEEQVPVGTKDKTENGVPVETRKGGKSKSFMFKELIAKKLREGPATFREIGDYLHSLGHPRAAASWVASMSLHKKHNGMRGKQSQTIYSLKEEVVY